MAKRVCGKYSASKQLLEEAEDTLGRSLSSIMFGDDPTQLNRTENTQVCLAVAECCIASALLSEGLSPAALIGFSLGEWPALWFASSISFAEMLKAVDVRAREMQRAVRMGDGKMAAVLGLGSEEVVSACERFDRVWPANFNSPEQTVISGFSNDVGDACRLFSSAGAITKELAVSVPSHCPLMAPAKDELDKSLESLRFRHPSIPVISNKTGKPIAEYDDVKQLVLDQMVMPVQLVEGVRSLFELGIDAVIESGPGNVLGKLIRKNNKGIASYKAATPEDIDSLVDKLMQFEGGVE